MSGEIENDYPNIPVKPAGNIQDLCEEISDMGLDDGTQIDNILEALKRLDQAFKTRCSENNRPEDYYDDEGVTEAKRILEQVLGSPEVDASARKERP